MHVFWVSALGVTALGEFRHRLGGVVDMVAHAKTIVVVRAQIAASEIVQNPNFCFISVVYVCVSTARYWQ